MPATKKQPTPAQKASSEDVTHVMRRLRRKNVESQKAGLKRASIKRLAMQAGALMIKDDAVDVIRLVLMRSTADLMSSAVRVARAAGRLTLSRRDLKTALIMRGVTLAGDYEKVGRVCLPKQVARPAVPTK